MNCTVQVESGLLAGNQSDDRNSFCFKGIPYAQPPVGRLRWRAPEPSPRWSGVRAADAFGPRCVQPDRPHTAVGYFGPEAESEDCLYLNVWTPDCARDAKCPVMVWLHGGALLVGSGALPIFDGSALARHGAVVVTVNFRLGRLGFLAHPELSREHPQHISGNYGHLDQIAALRWVRDNIAAFGGDPGRVTIFGQSAGSTSIAALMASPLAQGLFHRAIGQSGGGFGRRAIATLDAAEQAGAALTRALGVDGIDALRALPARAIQLARPGDGSGSKELYDSNDPKGLDKATTWSVIDGHFLRERLIDTFERGAQHDVPLLTGAVTDEGSNQPPAATRDELVRRARADYGDLAEQFLRLFPAATDAQAQAASRKVVGSKVFNWENWTWANLHARQARSPVYHYHFGRVPPKPLTADGGDQSRDLGAFHTAEIPYVFQTLDVRAWPWTKADRELSDAMTRYWVSFAATGDPNGGGLPAWPRFRPGAATTMLLGDDISVGNVPEPQLLAFWQVVEDRIKAQSAR
jgi:para-nitrobenzyl esterase